MFAGPDEHLGLFGAFGYDLAFQFEPIRLRPGRDAAGPGRLGQPPQRDLVLQLPDQLYVIDRKRETALRYSYEFAIGGRSTTGLDRQTSPSTSARTQRAAGRHPVSPDGLPADPVPGEYAKVVEQARGRFAAGDLFEVVPSHEFWAPCGSPAAFYERLRRHNPAPYEFFLNLGEGEYLVGASPEMYVRVTASPGQHRRVETCPIAGTIARGATPLEDAENISDTAQLAQGGVRADHVHRRGQKRQVADLRARQRPGDRTAADRDVQPAHPHGRSRGRPAAAGVRRAGRVLDPHVGGHRHRCAEDLGNAVHRGSRDQRRVAGMAAPSARSASTAT